jgi:cytochrome c peroxidase
VASEVPLVFVHEGTDHASWARLPRFWNFGPAPWQPTRAASLTGLGTNPWSLPVALAQPPQPIVRIKVPLGLDDPTPHIPAANPPTLAKWQLGKRLFFDEAILQPANVERKRSCATCHPPAQRFADRTVAMGRAPLTLLNTVYRDRLFWDGRATALEQALHRTPEDERDPGDGLAEARHTWPGVVRRLREQPDYVRLFQEAFGCPPTQDTIGKALATYLRTALSGSSVVDRARIAVWARSGQDLEARDFEVALNPAAIEILMGSESGRDRTALAATLWQGYRLFHHKAGCATCHSGATFTDNGFHNAGIGDSTLPPLPGRETGYFPFAPLGAKDGRLIGAYQTPTLRDLPRDGPFFHDGSQTGLFAVVAVHAKPAPSLNLDRGFRDRGLTPDEVRALVLFLRALDGGPVPGELSDAKVR